MLQDFVVYCDLLPGIAEQIEQIKVCVLVHVHVHVRARVFTHTRRQMYRHTSMHFMTLYRGIYVRIVVIQSNAHINDTKTITFSYFVFSSSQCSCSSSF